jgi:alcohol dehydrogenase class IV
MHFEFATASRILFGSGALDQSIPILRSWGAKALLVTGRTRARSARLEDLLAREQIEAIHFAVPGEPSIETIEEGLSTATRARCQFVIGFGGGSAIDAAKAIAALAANPAPMTDYLEVIGAGKSLLHPSLPCAAIPTTAGTGAEVTRNSVLSSPVHRVKVSLRSPFMLPALAVVDPMLTLELSPQITAWTGLDALTQLIEPYLSTRANPLTDGFCSEGIRCVARSLRQACTCGQDQAARTDMSLASLLSGLALANAGLGAVHGFAGPIGGMYDVPHGAVCAALLPHVMAVNLAVLQQRAPQHPALDRFNTLAQWLTGEPKAAAEDAVAWVDAICQDLQIPTLGQMGLDRADQSVLMDKAARASSMKANPIPLAPQDLQQVLDRAW